MPLNAISSHSPQPFISNWKDSWRCAWITISCLLDPQETVSGSSCTPLCTHILYGCCTCTRRSLHLRYFASKHRTGRDKGGKIHQRAFKLIVSTSGRKVTYLKLFGEHPPSLFLSTGPYIMDLMAVNGLVPSKLFSQHRCLPFDKPLRWFILLIICNSENVMWAAWDVVYNGACYCWLLPLNSCKPLAKVWSRHIRRKCN